MLLKRMGGPRVVTAAREDVRNGGGRGRAESWGYEVIFGELGSGKGVGAILASDVWQGFTPKLPPTIKDIS